MPRKPRIEDEQIIRDSLQSIRGIPQARIEFTLQKIGGPFSGAFRLSGPWGERYYYVKVVPRLTPTVADLVIHQLKTTPAPQNAAPLLVSHYISARMSAKLKQKKIEHADCAGNLYLDQMPLYVDVSGRKHAPAPPAPDRLFRSSGLKLIYLFLRNRKAVNATYRALADDAGIALGGIGDLFNEMTRRGNLGTSEDGERTLLAIEELLQRWQLGYLETLRPKLLLQRCRLAPGEQFADLLQRLKQLNLSSQVLIGGELAATLMVRGFQPSAAALYLDPEQQLKLLLQLQLTPDPAGSISLLSHFGRRCQWTGTQPEGLTLADPLLTFAELGAGTGDQLATRLYQQYLSPRFAP
ncbi:MAG: type IV toxin-antitoxin system AbiEi family antitoxin [Pelovirga sp.]